MTVQKTITIEVSMFSQASESALREHFESFIQEMKSKAENMQHDSWRKSVATSWDESYPVEIDVSVSIK